MRGFEHLAALWREQAGSSPVWRRAAVPLVLLLFVPAGFGQHGGGAGHPMNAARPAPARSGGGQVAIRTSHVSAGRNGRAAIVSGAGRGYRNNRGYGYYSPYFPLSGYGGYSSYLPVYGDDYGPVGAGASDEGGPPAPRMAGASLLPAVATPVIHEYKTDQTYAASPHGPKPNFTIVLKDGSTRTARASWVQGGKLHFVDAQSRQQLLLPGAIDRDATEKANEAKNLAMELPPG